MAYATRADMEARFGAGEIAILADDPDDATVDRTVPSLADACAVIDSYIADAYVLPLSTDVTWPVLVQIACDHARAGLYDDSPLEKPAENMSRGIRQLEKLRDGKMNLVDSSGQVAPRRNTVEHLGPDPKYSADALEGF